MTYAERRFELARQHGAGEISHKQWLESLSLLINEEIERLETLIVDLHDEDYDLYMERLEVLIIDLRDEDYDICSELERISKEEKAEREWKWAKRYDELNGRPEGPEDY